MSPDDKSREEIPLLRLVIGTSLAFLAFCAVPVAGVLGPTAFGFGLMRLTFTSLVAGLTLRRGDALWHPCMVAVAGGLTGTIALTWAHPSLPLGSLVLQAMLTAPLTLLIAFVVNRGYRKAAAAVAVTVVCGYALARRYVEPSAALLAPAVAVGIPPAVLGYHLAAAPAASATGIAASTWLQGAGVSSLQEALRFSTDMIPFAAILVWTWIAAAIIGSALLPTLWRDTPRAKGGFTGVETR